MEHNYNIVATGSSGNCIIIDNFIALDMGVPFKKVLPYYKKLKLVFISHCHIDHLCKKTIKKLAFERPTLKFCVGKYLVQILIDLGVKPNNIFVLDYPNVYDLGAIKIQCFKLYHDVPNQAFLITFKKDNYSVFYAVDTNSLEGITAKYCDLYLIEGNYDEEEMKNRIDYKMLNGGYLHELRTLNTHLSKGKAFDFLLENMGDNSQYEIIHQHIDKIERL